MADFDATALAFKMACPSNRLILDDKGLPGAYVERPKKRSYTDFGIGTTVYDYIHPAFKVYGNTLDKIYIGKFQGMKHNNRIYSLPGEDPAANITLDQYEQYCKNKGAGHHCITAAEWGCLALLALKSGTMPKGNNNYGKDTTEGTKQTAIPTWYQNNSIGRVATGTGPVTWSDTGDIQGVWDLNGNVAEWVSGMRLAYGELQVIPNNNAASPTCDTSANSTEWKAIKTTAQHEGELFTTPGDSVSAKLSSYSGHWHWTTSVSETYSGSYNFGTTTSSVGDVATRYLQMLALLPVSGYAYQNVTFSASNYPAGNSQGGIFYALRGGAYSEGSGAGVFTLRFTQKRTDTSNYYGGRPAYYE